MNKGLKISATVLLSGIIIIVAYIYTPFIKNYFYNYNSQEFPNNKLSDDRLLSVRLNTNSVSENKEKEALEFISLLRNRSIATSTVLIKDCRAYPISVSSSYGDYIKFTNTDDKTIILKFPIIGEKTILSGFSLDIKNSDILPLTRKIGAVSTLGYFCVDRNGPSGYILISD